MLYSLVSTYFSVLCIVICVAVAEDNQCRLCRCRLNPGGLVSERNSRVEFLADNLVGTEASGANGQAHRHDEGDALHHKSTPTSAPVVTAKPTVKSPPCSKSTKSTAPLPKAPTLTGPLPT